MTERTHQASHFEAQRLALLDEVAATGRSVLVAHGAPVARLVPVEDEGRSTDGSVTLVADDDEVCFSTGEPWDAG